MCNYCMLAELICTCSCADFKALELDTLGQKGKANRTELAEVTRRGGGLQPKPVHWQQQAGL